MRTPKGNRPTRASLSPSVLRYASSASKVSEIAASIIFAASGAAEKTEAEAEAAPATLTRSTRVFSSLDALLTTPQPLEKCPVTPPASPCVERTPRPSAVAVGGACEQRPEPIRVMRTWITSIFRVVQLGIT
jgi:hypothetical protein